MHVTYSPEDGDVQRWEFDPKRVRASKAEMIEKRFGGTWDEWQTAVQAGNMKARRVLLWHLMTVEHPTLRWEDIPDFYAGEVAVEHSLDELRALRERLQKVNLPEDKREEIMTALDVQITEAMEREGSTDGEDTEPVGKATSKKSGNATPAP